MNITMDALIKRINRKLAAKGEQLKRARGQRERAELGDYYLLDVNRYLVKLCNTWTRKNWEGR